MTCQCCDVPSCQTLISVSSIPSFLRKMAAFRSHYSILQRKASTSYWHGNITVSIVEGQKLTFLSGFSFTMIELNRLTGNSNTWVIRENAVFWNMKRMLEKGFFWKKKPQTLFYIHKVLLNEQLQCEEISYLWIMLSIQNEGFSLYVIFLEVVWYSPTYLQTWWHFILFIFTSCCCSFFLGIIFLWGERSIVAAFLLHPGLLWDELS